MQPVEPNVKIGEIRGNKQDDKQEPDTNIACFKCGCEEYSETELPYSLFRLCTAHRNKLHEILEVDFIY